MLRYAARYANLCCVLLDGRLTKGILDSQFDAPRTKSTLRPRIGPTEFLRRVKRPSESSGRDSIGVVDLFAGCGGLTYGVLEGARRAGRRAHLALAVELESAPLKVLERSLGGRDRYEQIDVARALSPLAEPESDFERGLRHRMAGASLIVAGPPCQGHSALNNHTRHDDPRNDLYLAVARVARLVKPKAVIVENVGDGVGSDRRSAAARCTAALQEHGYQVVSQRLDLHTLGVPQRRLRHVLVATRERSFDWTLPSSPNRDLSWAIGDLLDLDRRNAFDMPSRLSPDNARRIRWLFKHDRYDLPNALRPACHHGEHSYISMYGRLRCGTALPKQSLVASGRWDKAAMCIRFGREP